MNKADLRLDWCSHEAVKFALRSWYYRPELPIGKLVRIGVWERGEFAGVVLFGMGASSCLGQRWGLTPLQTCELVRLALRPDHTAPLSRVLAISLKMFARHSPGTKLMITFADPSAGHHGGIYQANGWIYLGLTAPDKRYLYKGEWLHSRGVKPSGFTTLPGGRRMTCPRPQDCERMERTPGKHRYGFPLDVATRELVLRDAKPYPATDSPRVGTSTRDGAPVEVGGATPTPALQIS
jgi:hypothetical protein